MKRRIPLAACLAACLAMPVLVACSAGDDDAPRSNEALPLAVGNQWQYRLTQSWHGEGVTTYKVTGMTTVDNAPAYVMQDDFSYGGAELRTRPYVTNAAGVSAYPASDATAPEAADGPRIALRLPLTVGDSWVNVARTVDVGYDYDEDGTNDVEVTESHSRVGEVVSVSTLAGDFSQAYPIETFHRRSFQSAVTGEVFDRELNNIKEWYVIGVGVVRRETFTSPYGGWREYHSTEVLKSYHLE